MNRKFDYDALEKQYVRGDMSLRELAASAGMKNHSLIMRQSKNRNWPEKRRVFREKANETALTVMAGDAGRQAAEEARVRGNAIGAIDDMITRLREDLKKTRTVIRDGVVEEVPMVRVSPMDVANLIDRLQVIFGHPSNITEDRAFGATLTGEVDVDLLRAFVEASRGVGLTSGASSESPLPVTPGTRSN